MVSRPSLSESDSTLAAQVETEAPDRITSAIRPVKPEEGQSIADNGKQDVPTTAEKQLAEDNAGDHIFVRWEENDPENPFNWPNRKKHTIAAVSIIMTLYVASSAVSYSWGVAEIMSEFNVSHTVALLGITVFTFGFAIAPMALAPLSEVYGRSPVYLTTYGLFVLLFIPQALSPNITALLVTRFLSGVMSSTGSTMVGGTLADIYHADTRGGPMSCFSSVTLYGTAFGSIAGAYTAVNPRLGFRWIFWIQLIINAVHFCIVVCVLRETRGSVLLAKRAARIRKETGDNRYIAASEIERESLLVMVKVSLTRPFVFLLTEPAVIAYSLWVSFVWGVLYLFLEAIPVVYQGVYGFSYGNSSLGFIAMAVGATVALAIAPLQDHLYNTSGRTRPNSRGNISTDGSGVPRPEARLYASMAGSLLFSVGMFLFGWCAYPNVHWIGSMVGVAVTSFGIFTIYLAVFNILADTYGKYASSALASQSFLRNVFASGFPLFANQLYTKLGVHWASSLLAFIGLALSVVPFVLYFYGPRIRQASKYASGDEK